MKTLSIIFSLFILSGNSFSQDCSVEMQSLKGIYSGECKKGKANGKGKAAGTDSYEGQFKSGFPEGEGTYVWSNGNRYTGQFAAGLRDGSGTMLYKRPNATDSVVEGFWKKDQYAGKDEHPYRIIFKSKGVSELEADYRDDKFDKITFEITNTSSGTANMKSDAAPNEPTLSTKEGSESAKFKIEEVELIRGAYNRLYHNDNHAKKMESILENVTYPLRMKAHIGEETIEIEFRRPGSYKVVVRISQ